MKKRKIIETLVEMQNIEVNNVMQLKESIDRPKDLLDRRTYSKQMVMLQTIRDCSIRANLLTKVIKRVTHGTDEKGQG